MKRGVLLIALVIGCTTPPPPTVQPETGPQGTSFRLQFCCWRAGTEVEKIFTTPDGRVSVVADRAMDNGVVRAGWGGSLDDVRGTYTVEVRGGGISQIQRFRIE